MKKLADLIQNCRNLKVFGSANKVVEGISLDSRSCKANYCFVANKGSHQDGHNYIDSALKNGASIILCESIPENIVEEICYIQSSDLMNTLATILTRYFNHPQESLKLIGITGTNGKTTTTTLLFDLFRSLGYRCGLISTVRNIVNLKIIESTHTTPDIISLYSLLAEMKQNKCDYVFMEVSSHAIDQKRIAGLKFDLAVFTNITQDHLDYHGTFLNYINTKKSYFDQLESNSNSLINADDEHAKVMIQNTRSKIATYGIRNLADYKGRIIENSFYGLQLKINQNEFHTSLIGDFNASNLVCVYAAAHLLGIKEEEILIQLSKLKSVEGRFDWFKNYENNKIGIIDYAHTPDAVEKILSTIVKIKSPQQSIITVLGCGGNRDKLKRPLMASTAVRYSDKVIFTADNPRDEDPLLIIEEMEAGVDTALKQKYISIVDREQAIMTACLVSNSADIILVAGKGHEKYQEIKGKKFPFDDVKILKKYL
ncbi:MAG: UDP-N-acetylmuramoyl-L-alanyl-D-glutamate--2,6-diaminopimelate ligase [Saprospiraceae bacterium]|nr:UDP-N-acetylmuramoyl-L-alanyl-D-glutamate--2,6-diaminopimelate ligase [Saprospiraceae bacterium]